MFWSFLPSFIALANSQHSTIAWLYGTRSTFHSCNPQLWPSASTLVQAESLDLYSFAQFLGGHMGFCPLGRYLSPSTFLAFESWAPPLWPPRLPSFKLGRESKVGFHFNFPCTCPQPSLPHTLVAWPHLAFMLGRPCIGSP